jgi:hypothetical protein
MDGYASAALMARISTFCEVLLDGAEITQIERAGDASADAFTCEIFTRRNHFSLSSSGGLVRISVQSLDSREETSELLVEVEASHERSIETLRAVVSAVESIAAMKARQDHAGLRALRRMIDQSLPITRSGQEGVSGD